MRCPECAADVPLLREFCPKCGTPMDPGLRAARARGPRPEEELKGNRTRVLVVGAGILVVLGVMGRLNWPSVPIHIGHHHQQARGPVTIGAEQLYQAYRDDPDAAGKRFDGREMVVSGAFVRTVPDGYGSIDMRLKTANPEAPLGVDLDGVSVSQATQLKPGQQVTVSCHRVARTGDERWLQDCVIQPPGEGAAPAAPAPPSAPSPGNGG